jgi:adenine-specific DNA-methyltransferase
MPILNWLNKEQAVTTANNCSYRLLNQVPELSYGDQNTDNMIINADNLEALKALIPTHSGQVDFIYIDPPYNTKSAFESYDDNLEHSKWLTMMYPRLEMLWQLLSEKGTICISINNDEGHYLKVMCDEIFGRSNFINSLVWNYEGNTDNQAEVINYHEYIHLYSKAGAIKDITIIDPNISQDSKLFKDKIENTIVKNGAKNPISDIILPIGFPCVIEEGVIDVSQIKYPKYNENLIIKDFKLQNEVTASSGWSSKSMCQNFIDSNFNYILDKKQQKTVFTIYKTGAIYMQKIRDQNKAGHFLSVLRNFGTTNQMSKTLEKLDLKGFTFPKPINLISYLIEAFSPKNGTVLDAFLGSGTTIHSVLSLNKSKGFNCNFIGIEQNKYSCEDIILPRTKNVINGNKKAGIEKTGGAFKYYRIGEVIFNESGALQEGISFQALAAHIWFSITRKSLPILINKNINSANKTPLIGVFNGTAIYLLYNGILGDKRPQGGNVLTSKVLAILPEHPEKSNGKKLIFGETSRMGSERLRKENIMFKQIPYDIKGR